VISAPYELGNPPGRDELLHALAQQTPRLDLATLAIARLGNPPLDVAPSLAKLDALGERVRQLSEHGAAEALTTVLGEQEGFEGDRVVYDLPANSFLDQVLERHRGLPILLSVLYLEVGRRAGLSVSGVALPGHFIVRVGEELIDPFNSGKRLTVAECQLIVKRASASAEFDKRMLAAPTPKAIATRILNNLKGSWLQRSETDAALCAVDLLLALTPNHPSELRLRAGLLMELGAFRAALTDVETCLKEKPTPPDAISLMKTAEGLKRKVGRLH